MRRVLVCIMTYNVPRSPRLNQKHAKHAWVTPLRLGLSNLEMQEILHTEILEDIFLLCFHKEVTLLQVPPSASYAHCLLAALLCLPPWDPQGSCVPFFLEAAATLSAANC